MNVGKLWETELKRLFESEYPIVYHPPDLRGKRFSIKKPCDFLCCGKEGEFVAIEAKATRQDTFELGKITQAQQEILETADSSWVGMAYLALNFRDEKGPGRAWLIPWWRWTDVIEELPRKSYITKDEVASSFQAWELERVKGGWKYG